MTAIEIIKNIMAETDTTLSDLTEYADCGSKSNIHHLLNLRSDMKVGTFVKLLETMGYQLVAQNTENDEEIIVDYEED